MTDRRTRDFLKNALAQYVKGDHKDMDRVTIQLMSKTCKDRDMAEVFSYLRQSVSILRVEIFELVIGGLLSVNWTTRSPEVISQYKGFLTNLVSAHAIYTNAVIKSLIKQFIPGNQQDDTDSSAMLLEQTEVESQKGHQAEMRHIHSAIKNIITIAPLSIQVLPKMIREMQPYIGVKDSYAIQAYTQNILHIPNYCPQIRLPLLTIVVETMIQLDARATRERIMDCESDEEEEDAEIFQMDTEEKKPVNDQVVNKLEEADRLDILMTLFINFIDRTCKQPDGSLKWTETKELYLELLTLFEKIILPTHESCHTQFLLFYMCSLQQTCVTTGLVYTCKRIFQTLACKSRNPCKHQQFCVNFLSQGQFSCVDGLKSASPNGFLDYLWKKVQDPNVHQVYRNAAVFYIASLIARAKYIHIRTAADMIGMICKWIHGYIRNAETNIMHYDLVHHGTFYCACQAVFYMLAFRQKEFCDMDKAHVFFNGLGLQSIVASKLNPLKICQPVIARTFASFVRKHQLAFCDAIIERNNRMALPLASSDGSMQTNQRLDNYFPFDPYLLQRSVSRIEPLFREYDGKPIMDMEKYMDESEEEFSDDDCGHGDMFLARSPAVEAFLGSVSPGFTHRSMVP